MAFGVGVCSIEAIPGILNPALVTGERVPLDMNTTCPERPGQNPSDRSEAVDVLRQQPGEEEDEGDDTEDESDDDEDNDGYSE